MKSNEFGMWLVGIFCGLLLVLAMFAVLGHKTIEGVDDLLKEELYAVVIDDVAFVCLREPKVTDTYVALRLCDGIRTDELRIKEYNSVTFERIE